MPDTPPTIPADILAKFGGTVVPFEEFDGNVRRMLTVPAEDFPKEEDIPKKPRGRPRKPVE